MDEYNQYFDLLALPKDVIGLIFNKLNIVDEIRSHYCIAKSWNELYWLTLTSVIINANSLPDIEDRHLNYILSRANPLRVYSLELPVNTKPSKLTFNSLSLLTQCINLKYLRLNGITSDLISQTVTKLVSLKNLHVRGKDIDEECMNAIADNLTKLTKMVCATSERLFRWQNAFKLTKLKELTLAQTKSFIAEGYGDIAKLSNLTFLNVNLNMNIDNESLQHILSMTNLEALFFMNTTATLPRAFSGLAKMTKLQRLQANILPDEETYSYLSQAYALTSLYQIQSGRDTPPIPAKFISTLTKLQRLHNIRITDTHLLTTLTNLESISAYQQDIEKEFPLQVMTNLTDLRVNTIHSKAMLKLPYLVKLQSIDFRGIIEPQENDFEGIQFCENLRNLSYSGSQITPKQLGYIVQIPRLESLALNVPPKCADECSTLTQLTSLSLHGSNWDLKNLEKLILTSLTNLKHLGVINNSIITADKQSTIQNLFNAAGRTSLTVSVYKFPTYS